MDAHLVYLVRFDFLHPRFCLPNELSEPKLNIKNYPNFLKKIFILTHSPNRALRKNHNAHAEKPSFPNENSFL